MNSISNFHRNYGVAQLSRMIVTSDKKFTVALRRLFNFTDTEYRSRFPLKIHVARVHEKLAIYIYIYTCRILIFFCEEYFFHRIGLYSKTFGLYKDPEI